MKPKILYENYGLSATWTASSEKFTLPATNLAHPNRNKKWRSNGVVSNVTLTADFGVARTLQAVALVGSNLTANGRVGVMLNSVNTWTGSIPYKVTFAAWTSNPGVILLFFAAAQTFRYMRLVLNDAGNADGFLELGVAYAGPVIEVPAPSTALRWSLVDPSPTGWSTANTPFTHQFDQYTVVEMPFRAITQASVFGALQTALRAAGTKKPIVLSAYPDGPKDTQVAKDLNVYGLILDLSSFDEAFPKNYPWTLRVREAR